MILISCICIVSINYSIKCFISISFYTTNRCAKDKKLFSLMNNILFIFLTVFIINIFVCYLIFLYIILKLFLFNIICS